MLIDTKYNINQTVWFMHDNKPVSKTVYDIEIPIITENSYPKISYGVGDYLPSRTVEMTMLQSQLFISKEELLKSL